MICIAAIDLLLKTPAIRVAAHCFPSYSVLCYQRNILQFDNYWGSPAHLVTTGLIKKREKEHCAMLEGGLSRTKQGITNVAPSE